MTTTTTKTKAAPLPFLTTHLANIALNKQIGLVFLLQEPQGTCGLTTVSHESLTADQLHVGAWMIESFLPPFASKDSRVPKIQPWMEFEPFDITRGVEGLMNMDRKGIDRCDGIVTQIEIEWSTLDDQLWSPESELGTNFLRRIVAQVHECIIYTSKRVEAIKMCTQMDPGDPITTFRAMMSRGPEMGADLISGFGGMLGASGIGPLGYLTIKNTITPPMVFSRKFLDTVRRIVEDKAVQEGYTKPINK